ncbi:hypothetical protein [Enterococcus sp.]|uniref:hypothetical protein n=1 Tax=Enterococcus sp. TaxID=35783 RepID=UPI00289E2EB8|nr:hypothetical protein [Enterococcus sp.]
MNQTDKLIYQWLQHSKEGYARDKSELIKYEGLWSHLKKVISDLKSKPDKDKFENDFLSYLMFTGTIYRYHKKFEPSYPYGIDFDGLNHSWTKQTDPKKMYILNQDTKYLRISRVLTYDDFGIDIIGYQDCGNKYGENINFGSPAIQDEQEIIYPLKDDDKNKFEIIKF